MGLVPNFFILISGYHSWFETIGARSAHCRRCVQDVAQTVNQMIVSFLNFAVFATRCTGAARKTSPGTCCRFLTGPGQSEPWMVAIGRTFHAVIPHDEVQPQVTVLTHEFFAVPLIRLQGCRINCSRRRSAPTVPCLEFDDWPHALSESPPPTCIHRRT